LAGQCPGIRDGSLGVKIAEHPVRVRIQAGIEADTRGGADGIVRIGPGVSNATLGNSVDVRRFDIGMVRAGEAVRVELIAHDPEDVWSGFIVFHDVKSGWRSDWLCRGSFRD